MAIRKIEDQSRRYQIIWDLGRRCTYACSYCPPHRNNKWSPMASLDELKSTLDDVVEYALLYDEFRNVPSLKKVSFTGGEPTANPIFTDFLRYMKQTYPDFSRGVTTNGWFSRKKADELVELSSGGTISYHCESTDDMKKQVIENCIAMKDKYKVNVMFHKDYFDECIKVTEKLDAHGVEFVPRIIGDDHPDDKKSIELGYTQIYSREQMKWMRNYWREKGQEVSDSGFGRPCCGGRKFLHNGKESTFLTDTNFYGWNCMVNWYFLFLNQEADRVWTHQTCGVNLNGDVAPLGKISEFDKIIETLADDLYQKRVPMITCPKTHCGCGMCITKSKDIGEMFDRHTHDLTYYDMPISTKEYVTTKSVFTT